MLIAFEGIDGAGKTTMSTRLHKELLNRGMNSFWTTEPTDGPVGKIVKEILTGEMEADKRTLALLFAADRIQHVVEMEPLLNKGSIIITDRYLLSSLAYQGLDLPMEWVREINKWARLPDLVIYLDLDPEVALRRIGDGQIFHSLNTLRAVRSNYLSLIERAEWSSRTVKVDASAPEEEVFRTILNIVMMKLEGIQ